MRFHCIWGTGEYRFAEGNVKRLPALASGIGSVAARGYCGAEYNEDVIVRGYLARSDQGRHLSSLKSASRLAKGLTAAGIGIARSDFITPV
jgi:hypothetical protein